MREETPVQGERGARGISEEQRKKKKKKKKRPSEIGEMTDTRFHPVEVTTMFVSRALCRPRRQPFHHVSRLN